MRGDEIEGRAWWPAPRHGGGVLAAGEAAVTESSATDDEGACAGESGPPRPGILLDRDGTIIVDPGYVGSVDRVEFIDGAAEAIARFNQAGIPVAVVTNQAGVARGFYGLDDVSRVHDHIAKRLAEHGAQVDLFLYCPYHPEGVVEAFARTSEDRKPSPGMARAAAAALDLDLPHPGWWATARRTWDSRTRSARPPSTSVRNRQERPGTWSFPSLADRRPVHPGAHHDMSSIDDLQIAGARRG